MNDQDLMPFGKHKGEKMEDVPASYLLWLRDKGSFHHGVALYIEENFTALLKECPDYINERKWE
jgi:uncharacterized protein (DUF3820 family)